MLVVLWARLRFGALAARGYHVIFFFCELGCLVWSATIIVMAWCIIQLLKMPLKMTWLQIVQKICLLHQLLSVHCF